MILSKDDATELVYEGSVEGFTVIDTELVSTSRWSLNKRLIFTHKDAQGVWAVDYQVGATEYQDQEPFEYGPDPVNCYEVVSVPCTKYIRKAQ